jgi:TolB-like protein
MTLALAALVALFVAFAAILLVVRLQPKPASPRSVAILPVRNLTGDPANDAFAEKLTEDAIYITGRGGYVLVTPSSSVVDPGLHGFDARAAGRRLHAAHVVLASLRRDPPGWRLAVQVIDARTGEVEKSQDIAVSDIQPSPESALASALFDIAAHRATAAWYKAELRRPLQPHDPENLSARIMAASDDADPADLARIDRIAAMALAATPPGDPLRINQGTAMCELNARRIDERRYADEAARARLARQALGWADRALAVRDTVTSPRACRAHVLALIGRWEDADAEVRHILAATPLTAVGWAARQDLDMRLGRFDEAVKDAAIGSERDMDMHANAVRLGAAQLFAGDIGAAAATLQDAVVTDGADPQAALLLAAAYELDARPTEARTAALAYRALRPSPAPWRLFAESPAPAFAARAAQIEAALARLGLTPPVGLKPA